MSFRLTRRSCVGRSNQNHMGTLKDGSCVVRTGAILFPIVQATILLPIKTKNTCRKMPGDANDNNGIRADDWEKQSRKPELSRKLYLAFVRTQRWSSSYSIVCTNKSKDFKLQTHTHTHTRQGDDNNFDRKTIASLRSERITSGKSKF